VDKKLEVAAVEERRGRSIGESSRTSTPEWPPELQRRSDEGNYAGKP